MSKTLLGPAQHPLKDLTLFSAFGRDPLEDREDLIKAREDFFRKYPDFGCFCYTVVNNDYSLFREGLLFFIDVSKRLECEL